MLLAEQVANTLLHNTVTDLIQEVQKMAPEIVVKMEHKWQLLAV
jgi:hypothetical protein